MAVECQHLYPLKQAKIILEFVKRETELCFSADLLGSLMSTAINNRPIEQCLNKKTACTIEEKEKFWGCPE